MKAKNIIFSFILIIASVISGFLYNPLIIHASGNDNQFDKTDVLADLQSSTLNGQAFKITDFPYSENKEIQIINFVEYCYSFRANTRDNYGLYIYVYNPKGLNISSNAVANQVQMAVKYDNNGIPIDYEKFGLRFCSKSSGAYDKLFYKFKVIDKKSADGKKIVERVNSSERRYDVSGIELFEVGKNNAVDYGVGATFKFSGFAQGYGADSSAPSSLSVKSEQLETVKLDVKSTYYRTGHSNKGVNHQNQLSSVYFAVPNRLLEYYGKLQKIKAEWYEYKTTPMVVTSHFDFFMNALEFTSVDIGTHEWGSNPDVGFALSIDKYNYTSAYKKWTWNTGISDISDFKQRILHYFFHTYDINTPIGGSDVANYIYSYSQYHNTEKLPLKDNNVSAVLFENHVDEGRTRGYNTHDIDEADIDITKMLSYESTNPNFWDKSKDFGFWKTLFNNLPDNLGEDIIGLPPIYAVKNSDLNGSNAEIANRLKLNISDVPDFEYYYDAATAKDETVFIFRFAVTDYYSESAHIRYPQGNWWSIESFYYISNQAYIAQETVFLDFDIIQLTFNKDGIYRVIPVVSSPIDIIGGITPPLTADKGCDMGVLKILMLVGIVLLIVFFLNPIITILNVVFGVIGFVLSIVLYPLKRIFIKNKRGVR